MERINTLELWGRLRSPAAGDISTREALEAVCAFSGLPLPAWTEATSPVEMARDWERAFGALPEDLRADFARRYSTVEFSRDQVRCYRLESVHAR